jgi:hypothetical protein
MFSGSPAAPAAPFVVGSGSRKSWLHEVSIMPDDKTATAIYNLGFFIVVYILIVIRM